MCICIYIQRLIFASFIVIVIIDLSNIKTFGVREIRKYTCNTKFDLKFNYHLKFFFFSLFFAIEFVTYILNIAFVAQKHCQKT